MSNFQNIKKCTIHVSIALFLANILGTTFEKDFITASCCWRKDASTRAKAAACQFTASPEQHKYGNGFSFPRLVCSIAFSLFLVEFLVEYDVFEKRASSEMPSAKWNLSSSDFRLVSNTIIYALGREQTIAPMSRNATFSSLICGCAASR